VWDRARVTLGFGMVGFYDDYLKVTKRATTRSPADAADDRVHHHCRRVLPLGVIARLRSRRRSHCRSSRTSDRLGGSSSCLPVLVIIGAGNSVNLTTGLDGLAIVPS